jgi:hypothetical protein
MNLEKFYESQYLTGKALAEYLAKARKPHIVATIREVSPVEVYKPGVGKETKPVLAFDGMQKKVVWGKQKCRALVDAWGMETDKWLGKAVRLSVIQTTRGPGIMLQPASDKAAATDASPAEDLTPPPGTMEA